ncbi:MAG: DUF6084 family protein [bacterium]
MPELTFEILSAEVKPFAAVPTLLFKLQITNAVENEEIFSVGLKGQVMIDAIHRHYDSETQKHLIEVFGEPVRWEETLNSLLWTYVVVPIPRFIGSVVVDVPIACSEDLTVASGKYFYALRDGIAPIAFLFSGTIFYKTPDAVIQVTQIPWEKEATFKLPIKIWQEMMDHYYPNSRWLRLQKDTFDKLYEYKAKNALPTLEACLDKLIDKALE